MRFFITTTAVSLLSVVAVTASPAAIQKQRPVLAVLVYDLAGVTPATLREAEEECNYLFRSAGTEIRWINCSGQQLCDVSSVPGALNLRIIARPPKGQGHDDAIGRAYLVARGSSDYLDVYLEPVRSMTGRNGFVGDGQLLAYAMAHEIGHIFLGPKHNPATVMRGRWSGSDLRLIHHRRIHFSRQEGEGIRAAVRARFEPAGSDRELAVRGIPGDRMMSLDGDPPGIE